MILVVVGALLIATAVFVLTRDTSVCGMVKGRKLRNGEEEDDSALEFTRGGKLVGVFGPTRQALPFQTLRENSKITVEDNGESFPGTYILNCSGKTVRYMQTKFDSEGEIEEGFEFSYVISKSSEPGYLQLKIPEAVTEFNDMLVDGFGAFVGAPGTYTVVYM